VPIGPLTTWQPHKGGNKQQAFPNKKKDRISNCKMDTNSETSNSQLRNKSIDYEEMQQVAGKSPLDIRMQLLNQRLLCTESVNLSTINTTITFTSTTCNTTSTTTAAISRPSSREKSATRLSDAQILLTKERKRKTEFTLNHRSKRAVRNEKLEPYSATNSKAKSNNRFAMLDMELDETSDGIETPQVCNDAAATLCASAAPNIPNDDCVMTVYR